MSTNTAVDNKDIAVAAPANITTLELNKLASVMYETIVLSRKTTSDEDFEKLAKKLFAPYGKKGRKSRGDAKKSAESSGPKRPKTAYMFFMLEKRPSVPKETKFGDVAKHISGLWSALTEEAKKPYLELAANDKARYDAEKEKAK